jgi:Fe-S-cluster-containing hydrogenase component 2/CRP-like cAMP-binding protein
MVKLRMPWAELERRPGDVPLKDERILRLPLFAGLRRKLNLDRFPGAVVLRTFRVGETIFRQGEAAWTAFYVLPSEEVLTLRQEQLARGEGNRLRLCAEMGRLRRRLGGGGLSGGPDWRIVGTVGVSGPPGVVNREALVVRRSVLLNGRRPPCHASQLYEGDLVGETSCMYRTPRPATVTVTRDCWVLEVLRNIVEQMYKEPAFRAYADDLHRRRAAGEWRRFSLFADLTDEQYEAVCGDLELVRAEPGTVICDEHERGNALYVVRSGLVRVQRNVSALLAENTVLSWRSVWASLRAKGRSRAQARLLWLLREWSPGRALGKADVDLRVPAIRAAFLAACNRLLTLSTLFDRRAFQPLLDGPLRSLLGDALHRRNELRKRGQNLPDRELRRCNRLLLEALLPGAFRPLVEQDGLETVLGHRAGGEWFGERALLSGEPHEATCTACGHPGDVGMVELVRIPAPAFARLLRLAPAVRQRVRRQDELRRKETSARMRSPLWKDVGPVQAWQAFEEHGLIQGQQLMLIDLNRCTRCDECVRACRDSHADGLSRLALDGPRLGQYLVPTTCRSCLDPVCLVGCPVGSIHTGAGGQIVIEDWCIGCGLCAESCPYGSIQMRDVGVLSEESSAWRFLLARNVNGEEWTRRDFRDTSWLGGESPFRHDRDLREQLAEAAPAALGEESPIVLFRCAFTLVPSVDSASFRLEATSEARAFALWVNGVRAQDRAPSRQGRREYTLLREGAGPRLVAGTNVLAVSLRLPGRVPRGEVLLSLRIDEVRRPRIPAGVEPGRSGQPSRTYSGAARLAAPTGFEPGPTEEVAEKRVTHRAAVCDLCSGLAGGEPACVRVCAHEAAFRVDARREFPGAPW